MVDQNERKSRHQTTVLVLMIVVPVYWALGRFDILSSGNLLISSVVFAIILILRTIAIEKENRKRN